MKKNLTYKKIFLLNRASVHFIQAILWTHLMSNSKSTEFSFDNLMDSI